MRFDKQAVFTFLLLAKIGWAVEPPPPSPSHTHTPSFVSKKRAATTSSIADVTASTSTKKPPFSTDDNFNDRSSDSDDNHSEDNNLSEKIDKINDIYSGWVNKKVIGAMKELITEDEVSGVRLGIKNYLDGLLTSSDDDLHSKFKKHQTYLSNLINNIGTRNGKQFGGKTFWMATLGEDLDILTKLMVMANYVPDNDCPVQRSTTVDEMGTITTVDEIGGTRTEVVISRQRRRNPCMIKFCRDLLNSMIKEYNRLKDPDAGELVIIEDVDGHSGIRLCDACCAVLGKDDYKGDIGELVRDGTLSNIQEFYMIALITLGYHARYFKNNNNDQPLPLLVPTANGRDHCLEYDEIMFEGNSLVHSYVRLMKVVPHGECWANKKYLLQYEEDELLDFGRSLALAFSCLDGYGPLKLLSNTENNSRIGLRYSGLEFMTAEEKRALYLAREYFYKCGTLAAALFGGEEELVRDDLEEKMRDLYDRLFEARKQADDSMDEIKFLDNLRRKYDSMVDGGDWAQLASAFAATSPPWTESDLSAEMKSLFEKKRGDDDLDSFVIKLKERYAGLVRGGTTAFIKGVGIFKEWNGIDKQLQNIWLGIEGTDEDEVGYDGSYQHILDAAKELRDRLKVVEGAVSVTDNLDELYEKVNGVLSKNIPSDDNKLLRRLCLKQRWMAFFERHSKVGGINRLKDYRARKMDEGIQAFCDNRQRRATDVALAAASAQMNENDEGPSSSPTKRASALDELYERNDN